MLLRFWDPIDQCCTFVLIVGPSVKVTETEQSRAGATPGVFEMQAGLQASARLFKITKRTEVPSTKKKAFTHKEEGNRFVLKMS